jgi:hypothetical protein
LAKKKYNVISVNVPHDTFLKRLEVLAHHHGVSNNITYVEGFYPKIALNDSRILESDVILCLGLLYHLIGKDFLIGIDTLIKSNKTVFIEGMFYQDYYENIDGFCIKFDPLNHPVNEPMCARWMEDHFVQNNYDVNWIDEWEEYSEIPGNLRNCGTRKLFIASPKLPS